jgi:hypothetical protein
VIFTERSLVRNGVSSAGPVQPVTMSCRPDPATWPRVTSARRPEGQREGSDATDEEQQEQAARERGGADG